MMKRADSRVLPRSNVDLIVDFCQNVLRRDAVLDFKTRLAAFPVGVELSRCRFRVRENRIGANAERRLRRRFRGTARVDSRRTSE